jgi:predicted 3-demethylubiquinone-9 3-methyltransferase (glyoxalase superfamily)
MQKIVPNLWYDNQAEEAANFYVSIFKDSKIKTISYYGPSGARVSGRPEGSVMTVEFEIEGQEFIALNGGPMFKFSPAISLMVRCGNQRELDELWEKLSAGGAEQQCGWLNDKYGVSWQIVPAVLDEMMQEGDPEQTERVMTALLQMVKLDSKKLQQAYAGK